ncbi:MAG: 1-deoxy-D-xylulose-5-phosphate synthase [Deltaproteobacteria bacterium]|nr:1-deoxy-D-xylulose-5-phosphate synthase [Deltaproteobacteria bacterium]MBW2308161.1 1-deoxy-D-xylulose-5-phosphate synthase [Deltaproteobacteria bacterium]
MTSNNSMLLDRIDSPKDLRQLPENDLQRLAQEIRQRIIQTVSKTGGHLASSLGVVELTIALHYVFDTPRDRLIWDVGHQTYAHKLLTGRRDAFHSLRQMGGISGFPRREESPYDSFDVGHSGTAISAAVGMTQARCLSGGDHKIIAVIGDGTMTVGMTFEGLNYAGTQDKDIIVILNDNEMFISSRVGALSDYLNRIMTGGLVMRFREEIKSVLKSIPALGESFYQWAKQSEEVIKGLLTPGILFEELGFNYVGPIMGHRLKQLVETLRNVKKLKGPILVHVITTKGKGYHASEKDPMAFHGVEPFDESTGQLPSPNPDKISYTKVFGNTLVRLAKENPAIVAITAAMPQGTGLEQFANDLPQRFFDVGIAEQHAVTFAAGLAAEGYRPVVAIYSTFLQRAYDQVLHDVCQQNLPVVFALDRGGIVGQDGATHQGIFDLSYLRHIPNLVVMAPRDFNEFQHMIKTALEHSGPIAFRYPRESLPCPHLDEELSTLPIGKSEILKEGADSTVIAIGAMVHPALEAARVLERHGISLEVINSRFVKPLDEELICRSALRTGRLITIEENVLDGGFGSAVLECLERNGVYGVTVKRLGLPDDFLEHGTLDQLRVKCGLDPKGIYRSFRQFAAKKTTRRIAAS